MLIPIFTQEESIMQATGEFTGNIKKEKKEVVLESSDRRRTETLEDADCEVKVDDGVSPPKFREDIQDI